MVNHCESEDYVLIFDASYYGDLDVCSKFMLRYLVHFKKVLVIISLHEVVHMLFSWLDQPSATIWIH